MPLRMVSNVRMSLTATLSPIATELRTLWILSKRSYWTYTNEYTGYGVRHFFHVFD